MQILVVNPGSSSIKFSVYAAEPAAGGFSADGLKVRAEGEVSGIGTDAVRVELRDGAGEDVSARLGAVQAGSMAEAIALVERAIGCVGAGEPDAVGYRVVHPGPRIKGHQRVTPEVMTALKEAARFAPLHDPAAVELIEEMMRRMPEAAHFACFDTVFHETMPYEATVYALPKEVRDEGVRRYGFHGLSCESVMWQMKQVEGFDWQRSVVIAHLGSGCSVTACVDGNSVDTTMGLTPTGGVVMGTRPGDLDPGVVLYLLRREGATVESVEQMLNHGAGLKGLAGSGDMRAVEHMWDASKDETVRQDAEDAYDVFVASVRRAIGGMAALHGLDAIVFTGGIAEHDAGVRDAVASRLLMGEPRIDPWVNNAKETGVRRISMEGSKIPVWVAPAQEDLMIARQVAALYGASQTEANTRR